ncbi:hypothetical protein [Candidatus Thiosymbion oneisti]|uniref:hypothetical protein n=1 Tax=Candidatus Thiosymbion oneisti TaxID=589554 RepID=UPI000B7EDF1A|nr:hypothetical protein [Candidatus Thiosymbion oneisti]
MLKERRTADRYIENARSTAVAQLLLILKRGKRMKPLCIRMFVIAVLAAANLAGFAFAEPKGASMPRDRFPYSFTHAPYIHPKIVQDLTTWLSDEGDQIIAIGLLDSQESNRYFGEVRVRKINGQHPYVYIQVAEEEFGYRYVGMTESGLYILYTSDWGGGSGVFKSLLFVTFEYDKGIQVNWDESIINWDRDRLLIRKHGEITLGDRWDGELRVEGDRLFIGKDRGWFTFSGGKGGSWLSHDGKSRTLLIDMDP